MPGGGKLTIETNAITLSENLSARRLGLPAGRYVLLKITDTGVGMDAQTQSHLFEPFFTTKKAGRGTGLGLATAYGIIRQSRGAIRFESEAGKGTTASVYLPLATTAVPETADGALTRPLRSAAPRPCWWWKMRRACAS